MMNYRKNPVIQYFSDDFFWIMEIFQDFVTFFMQDTFFSYFEVYLSLKTAPALHDSGNNFLRSYRIGGEPKRRGWTAVSVQVFLNISTEPNFLFPQIPHKNQLHLFVHFRLESSVRFFISQEKFCDPMPKKDHPSGLLGAFLRGGV